MAYITLANTNKIIYNSNLRELNLQGEVYKIPIHFLSTYEKNALLAIKELLKDPEAYFTEVYIPYEAKDSFTMVYEGQQPAYHKDVSCPRMLARYENFRIPSEIKERGEESVREFRKWFKTVKHLLKKPEVFVFRLHARWGIVTNPKAINIENSGSIEVENYSIQELEKKIDTLIKEAGRFYYRCDKNKTILRRFSKCTFLARRSEPIEGNDTGFSDDQVKAFLKGYDEEFKKPLKRYLIEYYRLKLNPDIEMEGFFLERLGFEPCSTCHDPHYYQSVPIDHEAKDDIDLLG